MSTDEKISPDDLLRSVYQAEANPKHGKLKIFLGMAAGVGKTFAMLKEAQEIKKLGIEPLVGVVCTHGRQDTEALIKGLDVLPPLKIEYQGHHFDELDLDGVLKRRPKVVLIDELAHSNVPGTRHPKRWQDVEEILDQGIDVYTTLNVQHIESLNDIIQGISDITVQETVPDVLISRASSIQLVDLTPDELLQRLKEGKVYLGEQSKIAREHFFKKDRLTALREIALRFTAERVDQDLQHLEGISGRFEHWKPRERVLVAISSHAESQKLIRAARRIAYNLGAPWIAVHVNQGRRLSQKEADNLEKNLMLARELGAEVITLSDSSIANGLERTARQRGVTQILIGRPPPKSWFEPFFGFSLLDTLARKCRGIDIHVIRQEGIQLPAKRPFIFFSGETTFAPYFGVLFAVIMVAVLNYFIISYIGPKSTGFVFLAGILGLSLFFRKGPILFASVLFALIWTLIFVPPLGSFRMEGVESQFGLALFFITAITTGILVDRAREQKEMLEKRESTLQALYEITRSLSTEGGEKVLTHVNDQIGKLLHGKCEILLKNNFSDAVSSLSDEKEKNAALWALNHGKEAGFSTSTLPLSKNYYLPLKSLKRTSGVLCFMPTERAPLTMEEKHFLYAIVDPLCHAIEREPSISEKTFQTFTFEKQNIAPLSEKKISFLTEPADKSRVTATAKMRGALIHLNKQEVDLSPLIKESLEPFLPKLSTHPMDYKIGAPLKAPVDRALFISLMTILIENALQRSPDNGPIEIKALIKRSLLQISLTDQGLPPKGDPLRVHPLDTALDIAHLFEGNLIYEYTNSGVTFSFLLPLNE